MAPRGIDLLVRIVVFSFRIIDLGARLVVFVIRSIDLEVRSVVLVGAVLPACFSLPLLFFQPLLDRCSVQTVLEVLLELRFHVAADGVVCLLGTVVAADAGQVLELDALSDNVARVRVFERAGWWRGAWLQACGVEAHCFGCERVDGLEAHLGYEGGCRVARAEVVEGGI